jgi:hypothetical protein
MTEKFENLYKYLLQLNFSKDFISLSNNLNNFPDKSFFNDKSETFSSNSLINLKELNDNFSSSYQIIKSNSSTLSNIQNSLLNLPSTSFLDSKFTTLGKFIKNNSVN